MANPAFPQLSTGAQVQYPLRKRRLIQSSLNAYADGTMFASNINADSRLIWELAFNDLTSDDQAQLQSLFSACNGALRPFTFIDPTGNMLSSSINLAAIPWLTDSQLTVTAGSSDPLGGNTAFKLVNASQTDRQITQTILAPAGSQYCFSLFASSAVPAFVSLCRKASQTLTQRFAVGPTWARLIHAGNLSSSETTFSVSAIVPSAQSIVIWGPQLEPQLAPSRYRPTTAAGGVYQNAHFLGNSLTFESDSPGLFSTVISIETT